jgi:hypothetical protein
MNYPNLMRQTTDPLRYWKKGITEKKKSGARSQESEGCWRGWRRWQRSQEQGARKGERWNGDSANASGEHNAGQRLGGFRAGTRDSRCADHGRKRNVADIYAAALKRESGCDEAVPSPVALEIEDQCDDPVAE